jgi:hypothetical protein
MPVTMVSRAVSIQILYSTAQACCSTALLELSVTTHVNRVVHVLELTGQMVADLACGVYVLLMLRAAAAVVAAAAVAAQLQGKVTALTTVAFSLCNRLCTSSRTSHTDT